VKEDSKKKGETTLIIEFEKSDEKDASPPNRRIMRLKH